MILPRKNWTATTTDRSTETRAKQNKNMTARRHGTVALRRSAQPNPLTMNSFISPCNFFKGVSISDAFTFIKLLDTNEPRTTSATCTWEAPLPNFLSETVSAKKTQYRCRLLQLKRVTGQGEWDIGTNIADTEILSAAVESVAKVGGGGRNLSHNNR
jgi:hypothetical protein